MADRCLPTAVLRHDKRFTNRDQFMHVLKFPIFAASISPLLLRLKKSKRKQKIEIVASLKEEKKHALEALFYGADSFF